MRPLCSCGCCLSGCLAHTGSLICLFVCSTLLQNAILTREKIEPEQKLLLTTMNLPVRLWEPGRLVAWGRHSQKAMYLPP